MNQTNSSNSLKVFVAIISNKIKFKFHIQRKKFKRPRNRLEQA